MSDDPMLDRFLGPGRQAMPGQARTGDRLEAQRKAIERLSPDRVAEAAANTHEIIRLINAAWQEAELSLEQCVFALCLATINYRNTMPEQHGGKEAFDHIAVEAQEYYDRNKDK